MCVHVLRKKVASALEGLIGIQMTCGRGSLMYRLFVERNVCISFEQVESSEPRPQVTSGYDMIYVFI